MTPFQTAYSAEIAHRTDFIHRTVNTRYSNVDSMITFHDDGPLVINANQTYVCDVIINLKSHRQALAQVTHDYNSDTMTITFQDDQTPANQDKWLAFEGVQFIT